MYMSFSVRNENIVVSFTTTPHRINKIQDTVATILKQNANVYKLYIAIPHVFKRDNIAYEIPTWLLNHPKIHILRTDDYGPATKILGVLSNIKLSPETIIITIDDDIKYPKNTVLQLAYMAKQHPDSVIGLAGVNPIYNDNGILISNNIGGFTKVSGSNTKTSILQGFAGIAYRRSFFDSDIFDITNSPQECINSDDVYLSFYLARKNISRLVLSNLFIEKNNINYDNPVGLRNDALHKLSPSPSEKHRACIAYLKSTYSNVAF